VQASVNANLVAEIPGQDFYFVDIPTCYPVGPMGGPMYRPWDFDAKSCPSLEQIAQFMKTLLSRCSEIVGQEIVNATRPSHLLEKKHVACSLLPILPLLHHAAAGHISPHTNQSGDSIKRDP
jgi:hypothetical protein